MWFPTQAGDPVSTFILQAWDELFSAESPETFRCRYAHIGLLVDELRAVSNLAARNGRWDPHRRLVQEELRGLLSQARVLELPPTLGATLDLIAQEGSSAKTECMCLGAIPLLNDLGNGAVAIARRIDKSKEKKLLLDLLSVIGTDFAARDLPASHLASVSQDVSKSPDEVLSAIESLGAPVPGEYDCVMHINGDLSDTRALLGAVGGTLTRNHLKPSGADCIAQGIQTGAHAVTISVTAVSVFHAANTAHGQLRRLIDLFAFYRRQPALSLSASVLAWHGGQSKWVRIEASVPVRLRERRNARELTTRFIGAAPLHRIDGRISNALDQFAVAQKADDLRVRLVGLWSALEALSGVADGQNVLDRLSYATVSAVAWRRSDRVARYLAICMHRCGAMRRLMRKERKLFPFTSYQSFSCSEVLQAVCEPSGGARISALLRVSAAQPLLRHRVYRAWELFHDPRRLAGRIRHSMENVRWNIARIYRARNLIVHDGESYRGLDVLNRHLEEYFSITMSRVLHEQMNAPGVSLEQIVVGINTDLKVTLGLLERDKHAMRVDMFVRPVTAAENAHLYQPSPMTTDASP